MAILKRGNKWMNPLLFGTLLVVLITLVFIPALPDSQCGGRISYATLLKNEWNKRQNKHSDTTKVAEASCKK